MHVGNNLTRDASRVPLRLLVIESKSDPVGGRVGAGGQEVVPPEEEEAAAV